MSDFVYIFNIIFSALTGWSLGYLFVYYRSFEYQRYYSIILYILIVNSGISLEVSLTPLLIGLLVCTFTSILTYDPIFVGGHKHCVYNLYKSSVKGIERA